MSSVRSAIGMNASGDSSPRCRVLPAHQRLELGDGSVHQAALGLVVQHELAVVDRLSQLCRPAPAPTRRRCRGRGDSARDRVDAPWPRCMAMPARWSNAVPVRPSAGENATPTLASSTSGAPAISIGRTERLAHGREHRHRLAASESRTSTPNSSPPRRAMTAVSGSSARSRFATPTSSSSPLRCPSASLMCLNPSTIEHGDGDGVDVIGRSIDRGHEHGAVRQRR